MVSEELRQLLDHMRWADAVIWTEALDVPAAEEDSRIRQLLHHVHEVQRAYLHVFREQPLDLPELAKFEALASIAAWGRECHQELTAFVGDLSPTELEKEVRFPWADQLAARFGTIRPSTVEQGLHQIASHSTYHRGQINTRIREVGGEPPLTDFVAWIWAGSPEPEWSTIGGTPG